MFLTFNLDSIAADKSNIYFYLRLSVETSVGRLICILSFIAYFVASFHDRDKGLQSKFLSSS